MSNNKLIELTVVFVCAIPNDVDEKDIVVTGIDLNSIELRKYNNDKELKKIPSSFIVAYETTDTFNLDTD